MSTNNAEITAASLMPLESKRLAALLLTQPDEAAWRYAIETENILQKNTPATARRQATLLRKRLNTLDAQGLNRPGTIRFLVATPAQIGKLARDLTPEAELAAMNLSIAGEILAKALEVAPVGLPAHLAEFNQHSRHALNSYVHSRIHPLRRLSDGFPGGDDVKLFRISMGLCTWLTDACGTNGVTSKDAQGNSLVQAVHRSLSDGAHRSRLSKKLASQDEGSCHEGCPTKNGMPPLWLAASLETNARSSENRRWGATYEWQHPAFMWSSP